MTVSPDKIRVLHIITRLIVGGAQEATILTAAMLDKTAWDVHILSGPQTGSEGSLIEHTRDLGIPLTLEPALVREINPLRDAVALARLVRFIRRGGYQVVHTHSSKAGILGRLAARLAGVKVIVHTVHGWAHHDYQRPLVRWIYITLEKLVLPFTSRLTTDSVLNIDKGIRDGIGARENYVDTPIRCGIELDRFGHPQVPPHEMRRQLGLPQDALVVGTVTRLSPQKSPLDLVEAFAHIHQQYPAAWFVIVGDGPLRGQVEHALQERQLADKVVLTGLRRDVPELLATLDVFVLTSLWEGLPRVLPQAMATGLPIVCTRADGTVEAIDDGVNGFLVEPSQPAALAAKVVILLQDAGLRKRMGEQGRLRAPEFGAEHMVQRLAQLYRELLVEQSE